MVGMGHGTIDDYLQAADRESTLRSYAACIRHFEQEWKGLLPASRLRPRSHRRRHNLALTQVCSRWFGCFA